MASKKKKKIQPFKKTAAAPAATAPQKKAKPAISPVRFAVMATAGFFVIALFGMLHHEMWRDEHQAWLVARDADSLGAVFENMKYEGNPALWQIFLFFITRFTHDPAWMQALHLLIGCGFIFVFNRYAPLRNIYKALFTLGYFPLYEYTIISRSYGLGILLIFIICALYKNRASHYILIGVLLALLANVSIYTVIIAGALAGILFLDYIGHQQKDTKKLLRLSAGLGIFIVGAAFSLYQIWPEKDNSFPSPYATTLFDTPRLLQTASKLFTTYLYIPKAEMNFWNTNIYIEDYITINKPFGQWFGENPKYILAWLVMPLILFFCGVIVFLRKPLVLLFYSGTTIGLLGIFYYTNLIHSRYCGFLLIVIVAGYWLSEYYPEKKLTHGFHRYLAGLGKKISAPFLGIILFASAIGAVVAYSMEFQYKFSSSKDAANYIKENKLDTLPLVGLTDFVISPLATYLDKKIYYPQMEDYGSFTIWNKNRKDDMNYAGWVHSIAGFMNQGHPRILLVKDSAPQVSTDGKNFTDMERAMIRDSLQLDFLAKFDSGIVADEKYYIYLVQKVDPSKVDYSRYIRIN